MYAQFPARHLKFAVVRPSAGVVSEHRTLKGARASLDRQERGARAQGGYSQDTINVWDGDAKTYRPLESGDYDPDQDIREGWAE